MTLADDVDLEEYIVAKDDLSGADIKVCLFDGLTKVLLIFNLTTVICFGIQPSFVMVFWKLAVALESNVLK